jgi:nucleoside-diphosphate-sugar epimerase
MEIIGTGLLASSLRPFAGDHPDAVAFASGVSDSSCTDPAHFGRELALLEQSVDAARAAGRRIVYFSSGGAVYGRWDGPASELTPARPRTAYGHHKVACERQITESGVGHLILRLPNVVGDAGHAHQLIPSLVAQVLSGHVRVFTRAARDLVDAGKVGQIVTGLLDATPVGARVAVNVATGRATEATVIVQAISEILGVSPRIEQIDAGRAERFDPSRLRGLLAADPFAGDDAASVLARHVPSLAMRIAGGATEAHEGST